MNRALFNRRSALVALVAVASTAALACRGNDVAAPVSFNAGTGMRAASGQGTPAGSATVARCSPRAAAVGSGTFGPQGGTLIVGESRLVIPGGALRDTVTITATVASDSSSRVDFEPHGLRFYKPVGLALDSEGCTLPSDRESAVVYLGPDGEVLETIDAVYFPRFKLVAAPIEHFSGYAIAFRTGGDAPVE